MTDSPLKPYLVLIGPRNAPRIRLEVMAPDYHTALMQHLDLATDNEPVRVHAIEPQKETAE